jgi:hypothetical protein
MEKRSNSENVVVQLMANRANLDKISLMMVAGLDAGFELRVTNLVEPGKVH